ncbi:Ras-associating domain-containing protein [Entamoeba marina]
MKSLNECVSEDTIIHKINIQQSLRVINGNGFDTKPITGLVRMNDFDKLLHNERSLTINQTSSDKTIYHKPTKSDIDIFFRVKPIPRMLRGRSTIQIHSYTIHFKPPSHFQQYNIYSSPRCLMKNFLEQVISKVNEAIRNDEDSNKSFLREDPETYRLLITDDEGNEDYDFPPCEFDSKLSDFGSFHFVIIDNPEYLDKLIQHRRSKAKRISLLKNTYKIFFSVRGTENMSVTFHVETTTSISDLIVIAIQDRNKRLNLGQKNELLSTNPNDYIIQTCNSVGEVLDLEPITNYSTLARELSKAFLLTGKGKYGPHVVTKSTIGETESDKPTPKKRSLISTEKVDVSKLKLSLVEKDSLRESKSFDSKKRAKSRSLLTSPRRRFNGKIQNVWFQNKKLSFDFDPSESCLTLIEDTLDAAFKSNLLFDDIDAANYVLMAATKTGEIDPDFPPLISSAQVKEMDFENYILLSMKSYSSLPKKTNHISESKLQSILNELKLYHLIQMGDSHRRRAMVITVEKISVSDDSKKKKNRTLSTKHVTNFHPRTVLVSKITDVCFSLREGSLFVQFCSSQVDEIIDLINYAKKLEPNPDNM